jgi:hypothetical protein
LPQSDGAGHQLFSSESRILLTPDIAADGTTIHALLRTFADHYNCLSETHAYAITGHWMLSPLSGPPSIPIFQFGIGDARLLVHVTNLISHARPQPMVNGSGLVKSHSDTGDHPGLPGASFSFVIAFAASNYKVSNLHE